MPDTHPDVMGTGGCHQCVRCACSGGAVLHPASHNTYAKKFGIRSLTTPWSACASRGARATHDPRPGSPGTTCGPSRAGVAKGTPPEAIEFFRQAGWDGNVDHALKEVIRIRLARMARDPYFSNLRSQAARAAGLSEERIEAGCGDVDQDNSFSEAERIAVRYADLMFRDKPQLDAAFYDALKQHYSEPQIMEMGAWAALSWGLSGWFGTLRLYPEHDRDGRPISQEESARLYGPVPTV